MLRVLRFLRLVMIFAGVAVAAAWFAAQSGNEITGFARVLDGDSIVIGGREMRLEGIDAPEGKQLCTRSIDNQQYQCGQQSRDWLKKLISGNEIKCEGWEEDKYQRLLVTCWRGKVDLNRKMVRDGWAVSFGLYEGEELAARGEGKGLWQGDFQRPRQWRDNERNDPGLLDAVVKFFGF